jgi:hypothetical protein
MPSLPWFLTKHLHVMRLNPHSSVFCDWSQKPRKADDLVLLHVSVSSHIPRKAAWGFSLIMHKCFQSQTMESWGFSLITRDWKHLRVMRLNPQPSVVCDWKHLRVMRLNPQPSVVCDWKHLRVMRINPQPSVVCDWKHWRVMRLNPQLSVVCDCLPVPKDFIYYLSFHSNFFGNDLTL